jgi:RNA polymerase sigma-70 factor (ECF subfamily)
MAVPLYQLPADLLTFPRLARPSDCRIRLMLEVTAARQALKPPHQGSGSQIERERPVTAATASRSSSRVDDAAWIRAAQQGDHAAFEQLVRLYDRQVLHLALNLLRSEEDARDVYQEAFLKAYRSLGNFRFECSFYTWMYRIVTNLCLDHLRKRAVRKEELASAMNEDSEGGAVNFLDSVQDEKPEGHPERDLMRRELGFQIQTALKRLTPRERMVFELKHYQGLKLKTIGDMLDTTEQTVKNCLFRATQKLRGSLQAAL